MIAAYVDGHPVAAAEVYERLEVLRSGPAAALLPEASTAEGRQLVRWLTQVLVTARVLSNEGERRGLAEIAPPWRLDPTSRVQLGAALAAALASSPAATAAAHAITADVTADSPADPGGVGAVDAVPAEADADADADQHRLRWVTSAGTAGPDNDGRPWLLDVDTLPDGLAGSMTAGAAGDHVIGGRITYQLGSWAAPPTPADGADRADEAVAAARNLALLRWVDERVAAVVRLEHGFEHPGDINQPDHTHHH